MKETIPVPGSYSSLNDNPLEWNGSDGLPHALRRITYLLDECVNKAELLISDMSGSLNPASLEWERTGRRKAEEAVKPLFFGTDPYNLLPPENAEISSDERRKRENAFEAVVPYSFLNCVSAVFNTDFPPGVPLLEVEKDVARLFICSQRKLISTIRSNIQNADALRIAAEEKEETEKTDRQKNQDEWNRKCLEDYCRWKNSEERRLLLSMINMGTYSPELRQTEKYAEWKAQAEVPPENTPAYCWYEKLEDEKKKAENEKTEQKLRDDREREEIEKKRTEKDKAAAEHCKPDEDDDDWDDDWAETEKPWRRMIEETHEKEQREIRAGLRPDPNHVPRPTPIDPDKMTYFDFYPERRNTFEYDYKNWKKIQRESILSTFLGNTEEEEKDDDSWF